jgi:hypothetical protein
MPAVLTTSRARVVGELAPRHAAAGAVGFGAALAGAEADVKATAAAAAMPHERQALR